MAFLFIIRERERSEDGAGQSRATRLATERSEEQTHHVLLRLPQKSKENFK